MRRNFNILCLFTAVILNNKLRISYVYYAFVRLTKCNKNQGKTVTIERKIKSFMSYVTFLCLNILILTGPHLCNYKCKGFYSGNLNKIYKSVKEPFVLLTRGKWYLYSQLIARCEPPPCSPIRNLYRFVSNTTIEAKKVKYMYKSHRYSPVYYSSVKYVSLVFLFKDNFAFFSEFYSSKTILHQPAGVN